MAVVLDRALGNVPGCELGVEQRSHPVVAGPSIPSAADAERVAAVPELRAFVERAATALESGPQAFFECGKAFETLLRSDFLLAVLEHELERAGRDSQYSPRCPA